MSEEKKNLSDIWMELQLFTMAADLTDEDRDRLKETAESLKAHVSNDQEQQRKVIIRWFISRLGNRLFTNHYKQLLLELANLMSTVWMGSPQFRSAEDVLAWVQEDASVETSNKVTEIGSKIS